jgi:phage recombination protein Bet
MATLPTNGDSKSWTPSEAALVEAAGLVRTEGRGANVQTFLAPRPTVEAFLQHCARTGLDPIARQIYAIYRAGKWGIQISIDGARLVAERSGRYEGQTTPEFTGDGKTWTEVWLEESQPKAARVGVYKAGFREPQYAVALWDAYAVYQDEWVDNRKTGNKTLSAMWVKMGPLMLAKCAEMLALRKAFPQDLSGLYSTEEMDQAGAPREVVRAAERPAQSAPDPVDVGSYDVPKVSRDWVAEAAAVGDMEALTALAHEAESLGEIGLVISDEVGKVIHVLNRRRAELQVTTPPLVDVPKATPGPRKWMREARLMSTREEVQALFMEAKAAAVNVGILDELEAIVKSLPDPDAEAPVAAGEWASVAEEGDESTWVENPPGSAQYSERAAVLDGAPEGGDAQ